MGREVLSEMMAKARAGKKLIRCSSMFVNGVLFTPSELEAEWDSGSYRWWNKDNWVLVDPADEILDRQHDIALAEIRLEKLMLKIKEL